jgi:anaerobic carbon-monoxide dehydrogenase iron sulfur subunit
MIAFDSNGCVNCRICEAVCSYRFAGGFRPAVAAIRLERAGRFGQIHVHLCNLCRGLDGGAACVAVCPSGALSLSELGGDFGRIVRFDPDLCIDCHACVDDCPEGAVAHQPEAGAYNICDLCGGDPACVRWCPEGVLSIAA